MRGIVSAAPVDGAAAGGGGMAEGSLESALFLGRTAQYEEALRRFSRNCFVNRIRPIKAELSTRKMRLDELLEYEFSLVFYRNSGAGAQPEFAEELREIEEQLNKCLADARVEEARKEEERRRLWEARVATVRGFVGSVWESFMGGFEREPQEGQRKHDKVE
jgi:hypothetical protein